MEVNIIKKRKEKKMEEERNREKENPTELQKPNIDAEVYNKNKKCDWIYTYTYIPTNKIKIIQQRYKYNRLTQWTKETQNDIYQSKNN